MNLNIKITLPKDFDFGSGEPETDAKLVKTTEIMKPQAGIVEKSILVEMSQDLKLRTASGKKLLLLPEWSQGVDDILRGNAIWGAIFLVPNGTTEINGYFQESDLILLGRAMVVVLKEYHEL
jgi:hypothetical protein